MTKEYSGCGDIEGPLKGDGLPEELAKSIQHGILGKLDKMDKKYSSQIHLMKGNRLIDCIVLIFGLMFNRAYCIIPVMISWLLARTYPQQVFGLLPVVIPQEDAVNLYVIFVMIEIIVLLGIT